MLREGKLPPYRAGWILSHSSTVCSIVAASSPRNTCGGYWLTWFLVLKQSDQPGLKKLPIRFSVIVKIVLIPLVPAS